MHDSSCSITWSAERAWRGEGGGSQTLSGLAALWPTRGSAPSVAPGLEAARCRGPGTAAAPLRLRGKWWGGDRWCSGAGRGTLAGSDSGRMCAGSAGTEDWGGTVAGPAEAPSAGRMRWLLSPEDAGCTPGALGWIRINYGDVTLFDSEMNFVLDLVLGWYFANCVSWL